MKLKRILRNKKGVELSMNTIIIAAIAIIVLIVIVLIFTGKLGDFNKNMKSCTDKGGKQAADNAACVGSGGVPIGPYYKDNTADGSVTLESGVCCVNNNEKK